MKAATVIMFLAAMTVAKHHCRNLRKGIDAKDFFHKINEDIHTYMEDIFDSINLYDNFTKESNIKKLLTMHHDLSNIVEKNTETLHEIQNASQVNNINRTEDRVRLDNAVEQILRENKIDVYEQIKGKKHKHNHERHKVISGKNGTERNRSEQLADFVIDFLGEVNNVTVNDLREPSKKKRRPVSFRRNLKVWSKSFLNL